MKTPALAIVVFLLFFTAVNAQMKLENTSTITAHLDNAGYTYDKDDIAVFQIFDTWAYVVTEQNNEFPDAYFFNSKGENVKFKGTSCGQTIDGLEKINTSKVKNKEENVEKWFSGIMQLINKDPTAQKPYDAYIILP